jgi:RNA polymerase sigma factor (sigma-70 family)
MSIERNNELFPLVAAGDPVAREAMIVENKGAVVASAEAFIRQIPSTSYLMDDLISVGYVGLIEAVNKVAEGGIDSVAAFNAYLKQCVKNAMLDLLPTERVIYVPAESSRIARQTDGARNEEALDPPQVYNAYPDTLRADCHEQLVDLRDIFESCCTSDFERDCLRLREEGYTFEEIGERLKTTYIMAYRTFVALRKRIFAKLEEE